MIKQRVADFAQFQAAFDELLPRRREFGLIDQVIAKRPEPAAPPA